MKWALAVALTLWAGTAEAPALDPVGPDLAFQTQTQNQEPIVSFLLCLSPDLDPVRARALADSVRRHGGTDLDPRLIVSIMFQESRFREASLGCGPGGCDHGVAQINSVWIRTWGLDRNRLQHDDDYSICVMARILRDLQQQHGHEFRWWGRYHSRTPEYRLRYEAQISHHLRALGGGWFR